MYIMENHGLRTLRVLSPSLAPRSVLNKMNNSRKRKLTKERTQLHAQTLGIHVCAKHTLKPTSVYLLRKTQYQPTLTDLPKFLWGHKQSIPEFCNSHMQDYKRWRTEICLKA